MTDGHGIKPMDEELVLELGDDDLDDDEPLVAVGNAIVELCLGDPEDEDEEVERTISWVRGFIPGLLTRQVADLFISHGSVCMVIDRVTVTVPIRTMRLLLEQAELIKEGG